MHVHKTFLPTKLYGPSEIIAFDNLPSADGKDHFALRFIGIAPLSNIPLVRIHSECITGDVLGSLKCDCGEQLQEALETLSKEGGTLIYLRQEGRGIGLSEKIKAYTLQENGLDTFEANVKLGHAEDLRSFSLAAEMLHALGLNKIRLLTRNPEKIRQLEEHGISVTEQVETQLYINSHNQRYIASKEFKNKKNNIPNQFI